MTNKCRWFPSGEEGSHRAFDQASADGALSQGRCAFLAHHQVSTGDEHNVDFFVHAHLAGALFLQAPQLLFHGEVCRKYSISVHSSACQGHVNLMT